MTRVTWHACRLVHAVFCLSANDMVSGRVCMHWSMHCNAGSLAPWGVSFFHAWSDEVDEDDADLDVDGWVVGGRGVQTNRI